MSVDKLRPHRRETHRGYHLGWMPDTPDPRDYNLTPSLMQIATLPDTVRNDLDPAMPPVYDQGQLGSCTANGLAGAFEYDLRKQGLVDFMPSRLFIYYNERKMEGTVGQDAGAMIRDGAKSIAAVGVANEATWPYDISRFTEQPTAAAYTEAEGARATSYERVRRDTRHIQAVTAAGMNVVFGITLWESFEEVGRDGMVPLPDTSQGPIGGHCMMIVGYEQVAGGLYFRVRNSWSANWADAGYCWMPAAYISGRFASDFWVVKAVS